MHNTKLYLHRMLISVLFCALTLKAAAQSDSSKFLNPFLTPATAYQPKRLALVVGTESALYTGATVALYSYWYKNYPQSSFHFFNDDGEWLQQDKLGHIYTAYFETNLTTGMYRWTGMKKKMLIGPALQPPPCCSLPLKCSTGFRQNGVSVGATSPPIRSAPPWLPARIFSGTNSASG